MKPAFLIASLCLFFSSMTTAQIPVEEKIPFPPDFGKMPSFLYVEMSASNTTMNEVIELAFDKFYKGKFGIYGSGRIPNETDRIAGVKYYVFQTINCEPNATNCFYGVRDLTTGAFYSPERADMPTKKGMEAYVKRLEAVRLENEKQR